MKDDGLYECHVGIIDKTSRNKVILDSGSIILTVIGIFSLLTILCIITFKDKSGFTMQSRTVAVVSTHTIYYLVGPKCKTWSSAKIDVFTKSILEMQNMNEDFAGPRADGDYFNCQCFESSVCVNNWTLLCKVQSAL